MLTALTLDDALAIAEHLRPHDRVEVLATWRSDDIRDWARVIASLPGEHYVARAFDGAPVAMGGFYFSWPSVAQSWMVATPRIEEVGVELNRQVVRMHRRAAASGAHRFQAYAMDGNEAGLRWLERLGYRCETVLRRYGKHREDFLLMGKVAHGV